MTTEHIVQFSTGVGSAEVARRVVSEHGASSTILLTADTLVEDADNWRFGQATRTFLGKDVAILRDRRGGTTKPLTLAAFRGQIESGGCDDGDWGRCGCT